ncbi:MAG TPA: FecR family protein [Candidatus Methylacidiphilales bacterium]|nr:FecR family protein [Candidatus Methylacidiphilales bacterium]
MSVGEALPQGTTVRTGADGKAILTVTPGSAIDVGPNSKLKINALAFAKSGGEVTQREAHLELTSGVVTALVDPSSPKITDFQIQTPQGGASARGTFYAVAVYQGKTYVSVKEGHVGTTPSESSKSGK